MIGEGTAVGALTGSDRGRRIERGDEAGGAKGSCQTHRGALLRGIHDASSATSMRASASAPRLGGPPTICGTPSRQAARTSGQWRDRASRRPSAARNGRNRHRRPVRGKRAPCCLKWTTSCRRTSSCVIGHGCGTRRRACGRRDLKVNQDLRKRNVASEKQLFDAQIAKDLAEADAGWSYGTPRRLSGMAA